MSHTRERYFEITLLGLILILGAIIFYQAAPFINGILAAITLYILLRRVNIYLSVKFSPRSAPWIITCAITVFILIPLSCLVWYVIDLIQNVNIDVQPTIDRIQHSISLIEQKVGFDLVSEDSLKFLTARLSGIAKMLMSGINNFAITLLTAILLLFFLLAGGLKMELYIARLLPFNENNKLAIIQRLTNIVRSNAIGIPLLAIIQGCVASVCYSLIGVPNSIEFGVLTGFSSLIPIIGTMLVWIPLAINQYLEGSLTQCIWILTCGILVISQCDNVLRMFVLKRLANIHPLITISGVVIGLPIFGFMGLIFGPLLVAMFLLFLNMFAHQYILGEDIAMLSRSKRSNKKSAATEHGLALADSQLSNQLEVKPGKAAIAQTKNESTVDSKADNKADDNNKADNKADNKAFKNNRNHSASSSLADPNSDQDMTNVKANSQSTHKNNGKAASGSNVSSSANHSGTNNLGSANSSKDSKRSQEPRKNDKSKKDFKSAKAEHKQQKREAAKLMATQPQSELANSKTKDFAAQASLAQATSAQTFSVTTAEKASQSYKADPADKSETKETTIAANNSQRSAINLYEPDAKATRQAAKTYPSQPKTVEPYQQPFGLAAGPFERRQLDGQSLVSRAVADALKSFNNEKFPDVSISRNNIDPILNAVKHQAQAQAKYEAKAETKDESVHQAKANFGQPLKDGQDAAKHSERHNSARTLEQGQTHQTTANATNVANAASTILATSATTLADSGSELVIKVTKPHEAKEAALHNQAAAQQASEQRVSLSALGPFQANAQDARQELSDSQEESQTNANSNANTKDKASNKRSSRQGKGKQAEKMDPHQQPRRLRNKEKHNKDKAEAKERSEQRRDKKAERKTDRSERSERNERHERNSRNERNARAERNERNSRNERSERNERRHDRNDKSKRNDAKRNDSKRNDKRNSAYESRHNERNSNYDDRRRYVNNMDYEILRPERKKYFEDEPILQTVVSHQYGPFTATPKSTLRTQLISVHTAKGTMMAKPPRRHPSKRRPYH